MSWPLLAGLGVGVLAGLLLRPVLDSYFLWQHIKLVRRERAEDAGFLAMDAFIEDEVERNP